MLKLHVQIATLIYLLSGKVLSNELEDASQSMWSKDRNVPLSRIKSLQVLGYVCVTFDFTFLALNFETIEMYSNFCFNSKQLNLSLKSVRVVKSVQNQSRLKFLTLLGAGFLKCD